MIQVADSSDGTVGVGVLVGAPTGAMEWASTVEATLSPGCIDGRYAVQMRDGICPDETHYRLVPKKDCEDAAEELYESGTYFGPSFGGRRPTNANVARTSSASAQRDPKGCYIRNGR